MPQKPWHHRHQWHLSEREREVVELVAAGLNLTEAAARMGIAPSTVKTHLIAAAAKMGTRATLHAVGMRWLKSAEYRRGYRAGYLAADYKHKTRLEQRLRAWRQPR